MTAPAHSPRSQSCWDTCSRGPTPLVEAVGPAAIRYRGRRRRLRRRLRRAHIGTGCGVRRRGDLGVGRGGVAKSRWAWFVAGIVLLDVGAGRADAGVATARPCGHRGRAVAVALRTRGAVGSAVEVTSALCTAASYASLAWWLDASVSSAVAVGAPLAMVPVVGLAVLVRRGTVATDWLAAWALVGTAALVVAADLATTLSPGRAGVAVGVGVALGAVASAVAAEPTGLAWFARRAPRSWRPRRRSSA